MNSGSVQWGQQSLNVSLVTKGFVWRGARRWVRTSALAILFATLATGFAAGFANKASAEVTRSFSMGFTPWLFDQSQEAIDETYEYINGHSDIISHHIEEGVPWTEAYYKRDYHSNMMSDWRQRKENTRSDMEVFVSISPLDSTRTALADYRGSSSHESMPSMFRGLPFNHYRVKRAYLNYAESVIDYFDPDYLAITVEPNELFFHNRSEWQAFRELYIETYNALKLRHPELPVFFTTSLHSFNQMRENTEDAWEAMADLWNYADIAAVSYYPYMQYPLDINSPISMLDELKKHTDLPIAISESGYPAETLEYPGIHHIPASELLQAYMLFSMLLKANADEYVFFVVWTHRDFDKLLNSREMPPTTLLWRDTGHLDESGEERLSANVWDVVHSLQKH